MPRHRRGWAMVGGPENARHSPLLASILEPALLTLLKEQPRHGYTLLRNIEELGLRTVHPSVVYRTLREMEGLTWIESDWSTDQTQGPPRRMYRLTPSGEEALDGWRNELKKAGELITRLLERGDA